MPPRRGKKAAAAPAAPVLPALDNCKIVLSGTFAGFSQAVLKKKIEDLGGTVSASVTLDTTQLIASEADYGKGSAKVKKAQSLQIPIVTISWLLDCETNDARPAEADYQVGAEADEENDDAQPAASQSLPVRSNGKASANGAQKRAASPSAGSPVSDSEPKPKKARGRKAAKVADDVDIKDEDEDAPVADPEPKPKKARGRKAAKVADDVDVDIKDEEEDVPVAKSKPAKSKPTKPEPALGEGQVAKRRDIQIPLDEGCPHVSSTVYIAPDGVIFDASLNQTNASNNNNKFYRIQVSETVKKVLDFD